MIDCRPSFRACVSALALMMGAFAGAVPSMAAPVTIDVIDAQSKKLTPCRIHLYDSAGRPQRAGQLPYFRDHVACPGHVQLELAAGEYTYEVERGPEFRRRAGSITVKNDAVKVAVELERLIDLSRNGWWSGELHVHRPVADIELLMQAEDLHVAPVITWWQNRRMLRDETANSPRSSDNLLTRFDQNRFYHVMGGEDEREGGALLFFGLKRPISFPRADSEWPSPMKFVEAARPEPDVWIDIEKPFWWDVPVWLASGKVDSIGIANNHMARSQMFETEAWGKPRDTTRLPNPRGNGYWTQEIYYHILNSGLRLPPSAGSASGVLPNPVGYNRMYVHVDGEFTYEKWWDAFRASRLFVTNGPLLRVRANGQLPGTVFTMIEKSLDIDLQTEITSNDAVTAVEIIKNGRVERTIARDDWVGTIGLGKIHFDDSGWFLVRTIVDNPRTFRFASTAPYYVELANKPRRISRMSAKFFADWVEERIGRVKIDDPTQRDEVLVYHLAAKKFWNDLIAKANAE